MNIIKIIVILFVACIQPMNIKSECNERELVGVKGDAYLRGDSLFIALTITNHYYTEITVPFSEWFFSGDSISCSSFPGICIKTEGINQIFIIERRCNYPACSYSGEWIDSLKLKYSPKSFTIASGKEAKFLIVKKIPKNHFLFSAREYNAFVRLFFSQTFYFYGYENIFNKELIEERYNSSDFPPIRVNEQSGFVESDAGYSKIELSRTDAKMLRLFFSNTIDINIPIQKEK